MKKKKKNEVVNNNKITINKMMKKNKTCTDEHKEK
jgi:hypothetical protein